MEAMTEDSHPIGDTDNQHKAESESAHSLGRIWNPSYAKRLT
jgi:hypothetical protein